MKLKDVEVFEGVVINPADPLKLGRIKATVPSVFDTRTMDEDLLPWIYPLDMKHFNSFTKMISGGKVWVIKNNEDHNEYYYLPYFEELKITREFLDAHYDDYPEVVFARDNCGTSAMITYDTTQGIILKVKDCYINIKPNADIICHSNNVDMNIESGHVKLGGTSGEYQPMVMGEDLMNRLVALHGAFMAAATALANTPIHAPVATQFEACAKALENGKVAGDAAFENLLSDSCLLNKGFNS